MTKAELFYQVAAATGKDIKDVQQIGEQIFSEIKYALSQGNDVTIRKFGRFSRQHHKPRHARNIRENTMITVPARHVGKFKPAKDLNRYITPGGKFTEPKS